MSLQRKQQDLKKMQEALFILRGPPSIASIQQALALFFSLNVKRMNEEITSDQGG